jgi:hypothetical protein
MRTIPDVYNKVLIEYGYDKLQDNLFARGLHQVRIKPEYNDLELAESIAYGMVGTLQDNIMEVFFRIKTFRQRLTD